jgi:hypothetical protein
LYDAIEMQARHDMRGHVGIDPFASWPSRPPQHRDIALDAELPAAAIEPS